MIPLRAETVYDFCTSTALGIFVYLIQVGLGGPLFGYVMARLTIWWLSRVFNDAVVEITITLASTYFTYYVGDELLGVSGVLAVVTLGVEINARRTNISPEVEAFLLKYVDCTYYVVLHSSQFKEANNIL